MVDDKTMPGSRTITPYDTVDNSNYIDLRGFPPKLRKLGKYLLQADKPSTIKAACDELKLNYESICSMMWKQKSKGNDFNEFIKSVAQSRLNMDRVAVYEALKSGAVSHSSTSHNDRKTYLQPTGDMSESNINVNVNVLTVGVNVSSLPGDTNRSKGVIDVEPFIPNKR